MAVFLFFFLIFLVAIDVPSIILGPQDIFGRAQASQNGMIHIVVFEQAGPAPMIRESICFVSSLGIKSFLKYIKKTFIALFVKCGLILPQKD